MHYTVLITILWVQNVLVSSFVPFCTSPVSLNFNSALHAKTKKKTKVTTSRTGGFGTVVEKIDHKKKNKNDDYVSFPALEDSVKDTLVPSTPEDQENAKDLPNELYDRMGQIYGFRDFNFPSGWFDNDRDETMKEDESISFVDLLSGESSTAKQSSASSDFGDLLKPKNDVFSDLIADASGENIKVEKSNKPFIKLLPIEKLPPFHNFKVLHVDPMVLVIDDFFTDEECNDYIALCINPKKGISKNDLPMMTRSKNVGKDSHSKAQRTSTTWIHHFKSVPALMAKASRLLGLRSIDRWEELQIVRYQPGEQFTWHLDAFSPSETLEEKGGQRVATLIVYLNDLGANSGGSTLFRDLGVTEHEFLKVQPKKGSALLFFPAAGGISETPFDIRTLYAGETVDSDSSTGKWIAQMRLRQHDSYKPNAPPGNLHSKAIEAIEAYCNQ